MKAIAGFLLFFIYFSSISNWKLIHECQFMVLHFQFYLKALLYFFNFCLCCFSIITLSGIKNKVIFTLFFSFSILAIIVNQVYFQLNGSGLSVTDFNTGMSNLDFTVQAIKEYGNNLYPAILKCTIFAMLTFFVRHFKLYCVIPDFSTILLTITCLLSSFFIIKLSIGNRLTFPEPYKISALLINSNFSSLRQFERNPVAIQPELNETIPHLIFIVDESIRGDMLGINGGLYNNTPKLCERSENIINFGISSSGAVCSNFSNIILMSGLRQNEIPDKKLLSLKNPNIFQYAKCAGYATNLIHCQNGKNEYDGFMTSYDFKYINNYWQTIKMFPNAKKYNLDYLSIEVIQQIIKSQSKSFTYLIKYGSHFHYEDTYPDSITLFQPKLEASNWKKAEKNKVLNSYNNSLSWTVDNFLSTLLDSLINEDVIIVYTSDHGQNLKEAKNTELTHCINDKAPKQMATVPILILSPNKEIIKELKENNQKGIKNIQSRSSHFYLFPSILFFMGYNEKAIEKRYGKTLFNNEANDIPKERFFNSGDLFENSNSYLNNFDKIY